MSCVQGLSVAGCRAPGTGDNHAARLELGLGPFVKCRHLRPRVVGQRPPEEARERGVEAQDEIHRGMVRGEGAPAQITMVFRSAAPRSGGPVRSTERSAQPLASIRYMPSSPRREIRRSAAAAFVRGRPGGRRSDQGSRALLAAGELAAAPVGLLHVLKHDVHLVGRRLADRDHHLGDGGGRCPASAGQYRPGVPSR